jgi:hypothetical protein
MSGASPGGGGYYKRQPEGQQELAHQDRSIIEPSADNRNRRNHSREIARPLNERIRQLV